MIRMLLDTVALDLPMGARALTISGEVGVGKTRLLAEMCIEARERGFRVLEANTYEPGNVFPYFPFIEALRPALRNATPEQLRSYLGFNDSPSDGQAVDTENESTISLSSPQLVTALARLFPELPKLLRVKSEPEFLSPEQEKFRTLDAVATLLERMGQEQPVLVCIDSLQWADSASLELTLYLTVRLHSSRVALVGVTRPQRTRIGQGAADEQEVTTTVSAAAATRALVDLMRHGMLLILPLGPLDEEAMMLHVQALLAGNVPQALVQPLLTRAEGNPFFLEELVRTLTLNKQLVLSNDTWQAASVMSTALPDSIMLAVERRLQGLTPACYTLLQVASLFGRTFPLDALAQVLQKSVDEVETLMDEAIQAGVMSGPRPYMFCQGIVQEVLRDEVPAHKARRLHVEIGQALEESYGDDAPQYAAELAHHYGTGGEREVMLHWSLLAGEDAARQQAHREAIGHFRQALKALEAEERGGKSGNNIDIAELYLTLGALWFKLGELEQAISTFQQALPRLQQVQGAFLLLARTNRLLSDVYRMQVKYEQTLAHLQAAHSALEQLTESKEHTNKQSIPIPWLAGRSFSGKTINNNTELVNNTERVLFLQSQAMLDLMLNRPKESEESLWRSHQLATELGDRESQAFALHLIGYIRGWGEQIYEAIRLQELANEMYVALGDPFRATLGDQGLGSFYQALGDMERARLYTLRGMERARRYGVQRMVGWLHYNQGVMALAQGNWESCEAQVQLALQEGMQNNDPRLKVLAIQVQAVLHFRRGNWFEAEKLFLDGINASKNSEWYPSTLALYGHFLAVTGRKAAARVQLDRAADTTEPPGIAGGFYIPFLAEGYLHLDIPARATAYSERIRYQHGLMYYGTTVDRILGEVAALAGDWDSAERAFEDALLFCQRANTPPEEATILYEQAKVALMQGNNIQRVHTLCERARTLFLQYGMQRSVAIVDTLLEGARQLVEREPVHKAGITTDPVPAGHVADLHLTKRELEVLQLVAEGHTDREVAEVLVISPRTVNRHLGNIFVKLDVPSRAAAVAYTLRKGLV